MYSLHKYSLLVWDLRELYPRFLTLKECLYKDKVMVFSHELRSYLYIHE